jgi:carboxypeptidase D
MGYTTRNSYLWNGDWPYGMTRGWEWYIIRGGMQDWAYYWRNEHHVTLEISDTKKPPFENMDDYWDENRDAMLWWMQRAGPDWVGWCWIARPVLAGCQRGPAGREEPNTILTDPEVGDYHRVISEDSH